MKPLNWKSFRDDGSISHFLFFTVVVLLLVFVLTSKSDSSSAMAQNDAPQITGRICCTFIAEGAERTCVAPDNAACDACDSVCGARNG